MKGAFSAEFDAYAKGGASLEVVGSHLAENTITVNGGYDDINVTGGIQADTITLKTVDDADIRLNTGLGKDAVIIDATAKAKDISVSGNLGNNEDEVTVDGSGVTNNGIKIDISGLEGYAKSTITGVGSKADTLIGGSGNDTISAGTITDIDTGDTLTGGAGNDIFIVNKIGVADTAVGISATITDFDNGANQIKGWVKRSADTWAITTVRASNLSDLWTALVADDALSTDTKIAAGMVGEDTYLFSVTATTSSSDLVLKTDSIVKLVGFDADDITAAMFIA